MSGIIAVYGLVISVLIAGDSMCSRFGANVELDCRKIVSVTDYSLFAGSVHLGAGLSCGLTGLAAGYAIGIVGDAVSGVLPHIFAYFPIIVIVR